MVSIGTKAPRKTEEERLSKKYAKPGLVYTVMYSIDGKSWKIAQSDISWSKAYCLFQQRKAKAFKVKIWGVVLTNVRK